MPTTRYLLHLFSTFTAGGPQVRTATIVRALGESYRHTIVGLDGNFACAERLKGLANVSYADPPRKSRLGAYSLRMGGLIASVRPDLVLTYNWGAIEAIPGARLRGFRRIIHGEDGFGPEEASGQLARRVAFRRLVLRLASRVVVPSRVLLGHLERTWRVAPAKRLHIPNGIDLAHFAPGRADELRAKWGAQRGDGDFVIGTVARLRAEKGLDLLVRSFAEVAKTLSGARARLVIVGDGPEEAALRSLARELVPDSTSGARVVFAGPVADTRDCYRAFDLFALSSRTEQMPISLVEAMACGLPVVATDVGDVAGMVSDENRPWVVKVAEKDGSRETATFTAALTASLGDAARRTQLGRANRAKAEVEYRVETMVERYRRLYEEVAGS